jgi:type IV secretory pathway VirB2 component (pilin)
VTTGWGNEEAKSAVRRTVRGGRSGRVAVFAIAAVCLALGIYGRSLLLMVIAGIATAAAAGALVRAAYGDRAARRLERRYLASPDRDRRSS